MKQVLFFLLITFFALSTVEAQSLRELQEQRKKTEESIALTNKLIKKNSKNKNKELSNVKLLSNKISYRKKLISNLDNEIKELDRLIAEKETTIAAYNTDLDTMKANYAHLLQYMWTRRSRYNQMMYVLAGEDVTQIYRRFRYLKEFSSHQKAQATAIQNLSERLVLEKDSLQVQKEQQAQLIGQYSSETQKLENEQTSRKNKIDSLKKDARNLKKQLAAQQKKRDELKRFVDKLIAEEAKKASKDGKKMQLTPEQKLISDQFIGNKGKLPWPVASGVVTEHFGLHKHEVSNRVDVNSDGIDIQTDTGNDARSIFDGEVTLIAVLPGNVLGVIIRHGEYCSFYANLSEVYIKKGDIVNTKQKIGKIASNLDGESILHFEVWKGKTRNNPELWLSK